MKSNPTPKTKKPNRSPYSASHMVKGLVPAIGCGAGIVTNSAPAWIQGILARRPAMAPAKQAIADKLLNFTIPAMETATKITGSNIQASSPPFASPDQQFGAVKN